MKYRFNKFIDAALIPPIWLLTQGILFIAWIFRRFK